jgi:hypothetical protein
MTGARFPHSETPGSQPGCRLPGAYRRLQRPSSAPGAKASTVCPKKLGTTTCTTQQPLSLRRNRRCSRPLCSSQETAAPGPPPPPPGEGRETGPQRQTPPAGAGSLRTQQRARAPRPPAASVPPPPPARAGERRVPAGTAGTRHPNSQVLHKKAVGAGPGICWPAAPVLLRKEVIQPHLPVRLPCYDFVPIADPTFDSSPPVRG